MQRNSGASVLWYHLPDEQSGMWIKGWRVELFKFSCTCMDADKKLSGSPQTAIVDICTTSATVYFNCVCYWNERNQHGLWIGAALYKYHLRFNVVGLNSAMFAEKCSVFGLGKMRIIFAHKFQFESVGIISIVDRMLSSSFYALTNLS